MAFYKKFNIYLFLCFCIAGILAGCQQPSSNAKTAKDPDGYELNRPYQIKLPLELDEISGLAFYPKDTSIFAINDERGWLYKIYPNRPQDIQKWKFFDGADFEDVVLLDSTFYVLESSGNIIAFRHFTADSLIAKENIFPEGSGNEFEILYYDESIRKLVMICKDCESDKKKRLSAYYFDPYSQQYEPTSFGIDVKSIAGMLGEKKIKFKPSAAAIHPLTGDIHIISAINSLYVIADRQGNPKAVHRIDGGLFKQPEGICFTPSGSLLISNEAADIGVADILIYNYQPTQRKSNQ